MEIRDKNHLRQHIMDAFAEIGGNTALIYNVHGNFA